MPNYRYKARDASGGLVVGTFECAAAEGVAGHLDRRGYLPVSIVEEKDNDDWLGRLNRRFEKVGHEEIIVFFRQLVTLINAGIPFIPIFNALEEQTTNPKLKKIIGIIRKDVESGTTVSDAMEKHAQVFSPIYVNMVRAGEASGMLDVMLERVVMLSEHEADTRARMKAATRYPMMVCIALGIAFTIVVMFVIPRFAAMYANFRVALPFPTRVMIGMNRLVQGYGVPMMVGIIALGLWVKQYVNTPVGRLWWDGLKLKLPVFGPIFTKAALSRFAMVFGVLTRSGLPILKTLDIVGDTVGNKAISRVVLSLRDAVRQGQGIASFIRSSKIFTPLVIQMIAVGEETGSMEQMMMKVSESYDRDVEYEIKNMAASLEPIFLVVIGAAVLFLALAIFLPWWGMIDAMKGGK